MHRIYEQSFLLAAVNILEAESIRLGGLMYDAVVGKKSLSPLRYLSLKCPRQIQVFNSVCRIPSVDVLFSQPVT